MPCWLDGWRWAEGGPDTKTLQIALPVLSVDAAMGRDSVL